MQLVHAIQVPATVQTVLAARIDRIAPEDKRPSAGGLSRGQGLPLTFLQAIADVAPPRRFDRLKAAEFLYGHREAPSFCL
jgi:hypothetical protein